MLLHDVEIVASSYERSRVHLLPKHTNKRLTLEGLPTEWAAWLIKLAGAAGIPVPIPTNSEHPGRAALWILETFVNDAETKPVPPEWAGMFEAAKKVLKDARRQDLV